MKTKSLINHYLRVIKEQGEEMPPEEGFDTSGGQDVTEIPADIPEEEMPMTSEGEDRYIADLIDAALFEPSPENAQTLTNLQSVMKMKRYKNAREEVLPEILSIIRPSTEGNEIRDELNNI